MGFSIESKTLYSVNIVNSFKGESELECDYKLNSLY